ncbi:MAG: adenosylcobinamide-GDP ribazoletransferase, partial [Pseudomonadota bacterium]
MRDSRIGAYGAIGLIMAIGLQAGLIGQIGDQTGLAGFMAVMLACELSGRSWFGLALMRLKPIDDTGLAAAFACNGADGFHRWYLYLTWLVFAVVIAGLVSPTGLLGIAGAQIVIFYGWLRLTRKHLGGLNGDCLGALMIFQRLGALATLVAMNASMMVQIP